MLFSIPHSIKVITIQKVLIDWFLHYPINLVTPTFLGQYPCSEFG
jgi:hypothetical protein